LDQHRLRQQADRCVKCGLCLAVCPTYALLQNEADAPRGRIALIQGLLEGQLEHNERLEQHLRGCLHCRNCQSACPSGVEYNLIIDTGLGLMPRPARLQLNQLDQLSRWSQRPWLQVLLRLLNPRPLRALAQRLSWGGWRRSLQLLPQVQQPVPARDRPGAGPALFLGCIGQINDSPAQRAFIQVCAALDIPLRIPAGQACCGALHRHQGLAQRTRPMQMANAQAFADAERLISLSSGCAAELQQQFGQRVEDPSAFLQRQRWPAGLLRPLNAKVALHSPCSLRNVLDTAGSVRQLLERIPQLRLEALANGHGCCGGAGLQLLKQDGLGERLAQPLLDQLEQMRPDILVTSSSGCALQLRQAQAQRGLNLEVIHPVELIARQLL
jgi:glycolate oxidase iron-sulfur subunit